MSHNIDMTNGRANIAFLGDRNDIWHRLGQPMLADQDLDAWAKAAGLDWHAVKVPAIADLTSPQFRHLGGDGLCVVPERNFNVRSDNGHVLGYMSDGYQNVQPRELLEWFQQYIGVDSRFRLDVAGSLKRGEIIWATAVYDGFDSVLGEQHKARLLMTTTFDGSGATINQATVTRVVCNNTLNVALSDKRAMVRTRHSTAFNAERVGRELARIAESFEAYKAMAEAMAAVQMAKADVSQFFKAILDIPFDAKQDDISTRKMNQFRALSDSYVSTVAEGTPRDTAWAALNAVTRYVDHDKSTRGGEDKTEARVLSAQFGTGANMKAKAVELLLPLSAFKVAA